MIEKLIYLHYWHNGLLQTKLWIEYELVNDMSYLLNFRGSQRPGSQRGASPRGSQIGGRKSPRGNKVRNKFCSKRLAINLKDWISTLYSQFLKEWSCKVWNQSGGYDMVKLTLRDSWRTDHKCRNIWDYQLLYWQ